MSCVRSASEFSPGILEALLQKSLQNSAAELLAVIIMAIISAAATAMNATSSKRCMASGEVLAKRNTCFYLAEMVLCPKHLRGQPWQGPFEQCDVCIYMALGGK